MHSIIPLWGSDKSGCVMAFSSKLGCVLLTWPSPRHHNDTCLWFPRHKLNQGTSDMSSSATSHIVWNNGYHRFFQFLTCPFPNLDCNGNDVFILSIWTMKGLRYNRRINYCAFQAWQPNKWHTNFRKFFCCICNLIQGTK